MAAVGRVAPDEMARTFNLGLGMVVVVAEEEAGYAEEVWVFGDVGLCDYVKSFNVCGCGVSLI